MKLHLIALYVWIALSIPILVWFRESVTVVVLISLYAIVVGHWSAYQGARSEQAIKDSPLTPDEEDLL